MNPPPTSPMSAVETLYGEGRREEALEIFRSLSSQIFQAGPPAPSKPVRRWAARLLYRFLGLTVRKEKHVGGEGLETTVFRHRLLERSGHPYAKMLLGSSSADLAGFVEGGDPMNGPYMMLSPGIAQTARLWDRLLLDSVAGRDVQIRFAREVLFVCDAVREVLKEKSRIQLHAAAAGTGLATLLAVSHLLEEGADPEKLDVVIADREESNLTKARRLAEKIPGLAGMVDSGMLAFQVEDLLAPGAPSKMYDVVTAVGILEYFGGHTVTTSSELRNEQGAAEAVAASRLVGAISDRTVEGGLLVANSMRPVWGARILEQFGKRFFYRDREHLASLMAEGGFVPTGQFGSSAVYDIEIFAKTGSARTG